MFASNRNGSDGCRGQSSLFRQQTLEKNAVLTPTPAVTDRLLLFLDVFDSLHALGRTARAQPAIDERV